MHNTLLVGGTCEKKMLRGDIDEVGVIVAYVIV